MCDAACYAACKAVCDAVCGTVRNAMLCVLLCLMVFNLNHFFYELIFCFWIISQHFLSQCAEWILDKIAKPLNETFTGLKCMLQGFRICFV